MRIHIIKKQTIEDYIIGHAPGRSSFGKWLAAVKRADWAIPEDIKQTFGSADLLGSGSYRVVFDIGGNNYRMICKYHFGSVKVHLFICWIATHEDYIEICERRQQFIIDLY